MFPTFDVKETLEPNSYFLAYSSEINCAPTMDTLENKQNICPLGLHSNKEGETKITNKNTLTSAVGK